MGRNSNVVRSRTEKCLAVVLDHVTLAAELDPSRRQLPDDVVGVELAQHVDLLRILEFEMPVDKPIGVLRRPHGRRRRVVVGLIDESGLVAHGGISVSADLELAGTGFDPVG